MSEIIKQEGNYYTFVIAVAKRAREILDESDLKGNILVEKPVKLSVDDFAKNNCDFTLED